MRRNWQIALAFLAVVGLVIGLNMAHAGCIAGSNITLGYPEADCSKPMIPFCFSNKACTKSDISFFEMELDRYERCIKEYVNNVDGDIQCAQQKRREAVEQYNRFIREIKMY
jgi:hypothetical protein